MGRVRSWDEHLAANPMPQLMAVEAAQSPSDGLGDDMGIVARRDPKRSGAASTGPAATECGRVHYLQIGAGAVDGKRGLFFVTDEPDAEPPF